MANKEQLAILKQGVAVWNKWREENPDVKINLRWANQDNTSIFHVVILETSAYAILFTVQKTTP